MNVLIIKDNKPGHYNQSEGLLLQLRSIYNNVNVEYCEVEIKSKISRKLPSAIVIDSLKASSPFLTVKDH